MCAEVSKSPISQKVRPIWTNQFTRALRGHLVQWPLQHILKSSESVCTMIDGRLVLLVMPWEKCYVEIMKTLNSNEKEWKERMDCLAVAELVYLYQYYSWYVYHRLENSVLCYSNTFFCSKINQNFLVSFFIVICLNSFFYLFPFQYAFKIFLFQKYLNCLNPNVKRTYAEDETKSNFTGRSFIDKEVIISYQLKK